MTWNWYNWDEPIMDLPEDTIAILYNAKNSQMQMAILMSGYWYSYPSINCKCGLCGYESIHNEYQFWTLCPAIPK
jgi:hypothetical protein